MLESSFICAPVDVFVLRVYTGHGFENECENASVRVDPAGAR